MLGFEYSVTSYDVCGSEVVAEDTAQEAEPKSGCMSSLDQKGIVTLLFATSVVCFLSKRRDTLILCNIVFTNSYSREGSIERGSYSMAYYGHESERHHFMEDISVLRMS